MVWENVLYIRHCTRIGFVCESEMGVQSVCVCVVVEDECSRVYSRRGRVSEGGSQWPEVSVGIYGMNW